LFTTTWDFETPVPETFERVVFSKTLAKILRLLRGDVVEIAAGPDSMFFRSGVVEARVQTIDGRYPNLLPILEKKGERDATLDVEETLAASRRVDVVNESKQTGELRYAFRTGEVVVSSPSTSYGEAEIGTTCRYSKPPTTVRFTNAYILDYLSSCVDEYVRVYFNENTPITFEDSLGTTIIMPLA
jgi:DNA polymerase III sliding clamp (beta) subunit (PCNA family)